MQTLQVTAQLRATIFLCLLQAGRRLFYRRLSAVRE